MKAIIVIIVEVIINGIQQIKDFIQKLNLGVRRHFDEPCAGKSFLNNSSHAIDQCEKKEISVDASVVRQKSVKGGHLLRVCRCEKWQL